MGSAFTTVNQLTSLPQRTDYRIQLPGITIMESFICFEEIDQIYSLNIATQNLETQATVDTNLLQDQRVMGNMLTAEQEHKVITTEQLVVYTDNSVTVEELRTWELFVLEILGWELYAPTTHDFLDHLGKFDKDIKRQAETIAAMVSTEYKFISAKQSVIAAASLAAAVQQSQKESEKTENVIELSSSVFKCSKTEIIFFMQHILELSPPSFSVSLKSEPVSIEYFTETKTQHSSNSSLSLTPTDTIRFEVLAA